MRIALFGATGGTGTQVLEQALAAGHSVQALARDPGKLAPHEGLNVIQGDVLDQAATDACVQGADAVICVLGTKPGNEPVEAAGTERILAAMDKQGVRRLIAVSSMGVGDSIDQINLAFRVIMNLTLKRIMQAKEAQERLIMASATDWTIVRPGGLTDGPLTGAYAAGTDKSIKAKRVSRADVADFVVKQLTDDRYIRQAPAVS
ncbi:NAD(P)-dependent oxidoreductase [uncultured Thiohalocapsa sp.]|uniref:NAD(P)-dependent oxidoreductase n=1 Tax=uncultured Thiohalocapsa sp. TaxID=768990 RepID=UPI0025F37C1A|nr:SDR family oxidoreductase [uncultured Thiohalocapsa sp.]